MWNRATRIMLIGCVAMAGTISLFAQDLQRRAVDLTSVDGVHLKASYFPAANFGPAIMLLHMCGTPAGRKTWDHLGSMLASNGFHVLALDYRGYGESGDIPFSQQSAEAEKCAEAKWPFDIDIALAYLLSQPQVDRKAIGVAGASCGAENSVALAVRHPEVRSLVLLSGVANSEGLSYIRQNRSLAILAAGSDDDGTVVPYMRWLLGFAASPRTKLLEYAKAGHGTNMFSAEKDLEPEIVRWFADTLRPGSARPAGIRAEAGKAEVDREFWSAITAPDGAAHSMQIYQAAKKRHPNAIPFPLTAMNLLGQERLESGNLWDALQFFKLGVEAYPNSTYAHCLLAKAYLQQGNHDLALSTTQRALQLIEKEALRDSTREYLRGTIQKLLGQLSVTSNR